MIRQWIASIIACMTAGMLFGADFTWLDAPVSANWNETDTNWTGAASVWSSAPTNNAFFGASGTKTVTAGSLILSNLTFSVDGYTVGGGSLLMNGGFSVGSGMRALLNATVTNNFGVCEKTGSGSLVLDSGVGFTNLFSTFRITQGVVQITGGTHEVCTNSGGTIYVGFDVNGGTLLVSGGKIRTTSTGYSDIRGSGSLLITNGIVDLSSSQETLNAFNGAGTTTVSGNGVLDVTKIRISQTTLQPATVNVNTGGVIRLNYFTIDPGASPKGMVNFNGGTVIAKTSTSDFLGTWTNKWLTGISANILEGGAVIDTQGNVISIKQPLISGATVDGGLRKKGTGTLSLLSTNSYNGPTVIESGTLIFDPQTNTQTLRNTVTCTDTNGTLGKTGSGILVLDPGAAAVNSFGTLWCSNGTMLVASGTNLVTRFCGVQNGPGLRVSGGILLVAGGVLKTTDLKFVNVDGGHLLITNGFVDTTSCDEVLNSIGGNGFGYTTVSGSGLLSAKRIRISQNAYAYTNSVVTVSTGGVLRTTGFYIDIAADQKGMLILNGGTVEARNSTPDFLGTTATYTGGNNDRWLLNILVRVREGGAIFNTAGYDISIKQPLVPDVASDGGLTKRGNGTLTLLNTNTYNGATSVESGTLKLGVLTNTLFTGSSVFVSSNAVFDVDGKVQTLWGIGGSGTVTNNGLLTVTGTVAPGDTNTFGTLVLAMPCALSGTFFATVSNTGNCGQLRVSGNLDLSGLTATVANPDALNKDYRYVVATYTGALTGTFSSATLPKRWMVQYDTAHSCVYLIYNRGTLITLQ